MYLGVLGGTWGHLEVFEGTLRVLGGTWWYFEVILGYLGLWRGNQGTWGVIGAT